MPNAMKCRALPHGPNKIRRAFTLVEAMVAISITALAGSLVLLAVETSFDSTNDSVEQTLALGLAQQLMDEVSGRRYAGFGESSVKAPLGPGSWEAQGAGRERYDDVGDYAGYQAQPPKARFGQTVGNEDGSGQRHPNFQVAAGYFDKWRQRVDVYYVSDLDLTARLTSGLTSGHRVVEVWIEKVDADGTVHTLAHLKRVFAYVPTLL